MYFSKEFAILFRKTTKEGKLEQSVKIPLIFTIEHGHVLPLSFLRLIDCIKVLFIAISIYDDASLSLIA